MSDQPKSLFDDPKRVELRLSIELPECEPAYGGETHQPGRPALWITHGDEHSRTLQIELGNDYAVTITFSDQFGPGVQLWHGSGECSLDDQSLSSFEEHCRTCATREPMGTGAWRTSSASSSWPPR